jgi:hypothetical protein
VSHDEIELGKWSMTTLTKLRYTKGCRKTIPCILRARIHVTEELTTIGHVTSVFMLINHLIKSISCVEPDVDVFILPKLSQWTKTSIKSSIQTRY